MESKARLKQVFRDLQTNKTVLSFEVDYQPDIDAIDGKELRLTAVQWRERRSKDANALLWACIGEIASALNTDKWDVYLMSLKRYGKFTHVLVREEAVESVRQQWRETEVIGEVDVNGQKAIQLLCYYGSSFYDSKEMSVLIDGVMSEMEQIGLERPAPAELRRALDEWEKQHNPDKQSVPAVR